LVRLTNISVLRRESSEQIAYHLYSTCDRSAVYRAQSSIAASTTVGNPYKENLNETHESDEAVCEDFL